MLLILAGVYMALTAWGIGIAWIDVAFVLLIALGVQVFALNAKRLHTIHVEAEGLSEGSISVSLAKRIHDPVLRSSAQIVPVITLGIVFLMTIKPNLVGSLLTTIIAVMLGALSVLPTWRSE